MFSGKMESLDATDIIVLPEMFSTGFTMNTRDLAEKPGGLTMQWMQKMAAEKNCVVTGSFIVEDQLALRPGKTGYFNRLVWMSPDGNYSYYDKKHLFRYAGEQQYYSAGNKKIIVEVNGWKICPMICYDLRFPVWIRNHINPGNSSSVNPNNDSATYDLLIFVANWPEKRNHPWKTLLQARAMENQAYVAGVNRIGSDGSNFSYSGDSMVINPKGEIISKTKAQEDTVETITLLWQELEEWRNSFPAWMDADGFNLT